MFYLIRHGQADYSEKHTKIYEGVGIDFSPLSPDGIRQIKRTALDPRLKNAELILSSPYTRALHTAALLSKELQKDISVETDLHEWMANKNYQYNAAHMPDNYKEFMDCKGEYPDGIEREWEDNRRLQNRLTGVLEKYRKYGHVIVVCHGILIHSVAPDHWPENGEIIEYGGDL